MTEGELKKRLLPYMDKLEGEFGAGESGESFQEELDTLLDEVRKEILTLVPEVEDPWRMKSYEELVLHGRANSYVLLVVALKKWFGVPKKEAGS